MRLPVSRSRLQTFLVKGSYPIGICAGPDGNVWFTESGDNEIGRVTLSLEGIPIPLGGTASLLFLGLGLALIGLVMIRRLG